MFKWLVVFRFVCWLVGSAHKSRKIQSIQHTTREKCIRFSTHLVKNILDSAHNSQKKYSIQHTTRKKIFDEAHNSRKKYSIQHTTREKIFDSLHNSRKKCQYSIQHASRRLTVSFFRASFPLLFVDRRGSTRAAKGRPCRHPNPVLYKKQKKK